MWAGFEEQREYSMADMLADIDEAQPAREQLGDAFLSAVERSTLDIRPGDEVFDYGFDGLVVSHAVEFIAPEGSLYPGLPVVGRYRKPDGSPDLDKPNNYLRVDCYRVAQIVAA